ncbi:LOW QUALITY PROTEIN: hypothetical protein Cgig2_016772 [Carnegiea gigantea]|uniref:Uncharacterized protein n=1 Tax=Carnegiea gigantea TaxID=171969 RepID=A0A9Q1JUC6_9CARY|nr:LOW QUALITY PROTEIN: hypothetical protein Cgig2_016772 [Carnegiea gigantea]
MDGSLGNERAMLQDGRECESGPYYQCACSLHSLNVIPSSYLTSIVVKKNQSRILCYHRNDENKCVDVSKDYGNYFGEPLKQTDIFGAVIGISPHDLDQFGGLPILGAIYEEFLPPNKDLIDHNKYHSTIIDLPGYIYHGLGQAASRADHPGWLAEVFPCLYRYCPDSDCPVTFLVLFIMLGCLGVDLHYLRLDMFLGMVDIFFSGLAHIARTLIMAET